jgi:hypothetical protein
MRIFISSTFRDLRAERDAAVEALRRIGLVPWGMELFISEPTTPLQVALEELQMSDAVVLIVGFKAGSLIPDDSTLTYTGAEFQRARELGKPIFVFLKTEAGAWRNEETSPALKEALDKFKQAVLDSGITPAYFDSSDRLQIELLLAIEKWNAQGRPGSRLVFTTREEFFAPYQSATPRLFDFKQTLRGRDSEIQALNQFLATPQQIVGVLTGRGGIGKSKLLHDWTGSVPGAKILYVREDADWHPEAAKEIPADNVVIVVDDAHRLTFLDRLLIAVRDLQGKRSLKLVLGTRPSGTGPIDAELAARLDPSQVQRFRQLERVGHRSVIELAAESLGAGHAQYAPALAAVSSDTPLVTVVGGRLIARGDISPALLANEEDFRREVFDRFSNEYERLLPAGPVNWRNLLNLIAALGPVEPADKKFQVPAADLLHVRPDEVVAAINQLERNGLLLRAGRLVRIVPDLLSDFLLEGACITAGGESTGFADVVFQKFPPEYLSPLLRNLGELDWRITQRNQDQGSRLLDQIWTEIDRSFEASDASDRVQLLKALGDAALFQPARTMQLIRRAMASEAKEKVLLVDWKITQEHVIREIPSLLRVIALHQEHFDESADLLWRLAQRDNRPPNQYPEHAQRALKDLAEYGRYKPVVINDRMADLAARVSRQSGAFEGSFTPLDIADKLLAKEGEFTESEGFTISIGGFALNYPAIKPIREKALILIELCLNSENPKASRRAVESLAHVLSGFLPAIVRQAAPEEIAWQDQERMSALQILESRLRIEKRVPIIRQIRSVLRRARPHNREKPIGQRITEILAGVPPTDDLLIFDAFSTGEWELDPEFQSIEEAGRARRALLLRGVELFRQMHSTPARQIDALIELIKEGELSGTPIGNRCYDFIDELCADPAFRDELIAYVQRDDADALLAQMICIPLRRLRSLDAARYRRVGVQCAAHKNALVAYGTANAVSYGPNLNNPIPEDLSILAALADHSTAMVRHLTFTGIRRIGTHAEYERDAVSLLIRCEIGDDARMADEMCGAVDYAGIPLGNLSEEDIRALLRKLVLTKEIDNHQNHHIGRFLAWVGQNYPVALCEFVIQRLDRYAEIESSGESSGGYAPVPHHRFGGAFHTLQGTAHYRDFLFRVRDRFVSMPEQRYWLRELFWSIGTQDSATLSAIDDLLHSGDAEQIKAAIGLVEGAPAELALNCPMFAAHMIEECERASHQLGEYALSALVGNAHSGGFQRTPGQPSPKFLSMRDRSAALRENFPAGPLGRRLFQTLHDSAVAAMDRERKDDEQIEFS